MDFVNRKHGPFQRDTHIAGIQRMGTLMVLLTVFNTFYGLWGRSIRESSFKSIFTGPGRDSESPGEKEVNQNVKRNLAQIVQEEMSFFRIILVPLLLLEITLSYVFELFLSCLFMETF